MEDTWKRLMAAIALSFALPQFVVNLGSRLQAAPEEQQQTAATDVSADTQREPVLIRLIMEDGAVTEMELEAYVLGAVLGEMPAGFEAEALKAQAVAARTYALRRFILGDRHSIGAVCMDPGCCQAWMSEEAYLAERGTRQDLEKVAGAVAETAGLVLTYEGSLAECTYFSCSGGQTEDAVAVWGEEIPYLRAVDSPGEEAAEVYEARIRFTAAEFAAALGRELAGSPSDWLGAAVYTEGGGVRTMAVAGISYSGVELRALLGLNSTAFTMTADENGITVVTRGKGHRVGMSQYGADAMAAAGSTFEEILWYYYRGTEIDKMDGLL